MHSDNAAAHQPVRDARKSGRAHHVGESLRLGEVADRLDQIAIGFGVADYRAPERRNDIEGIKVVNLIEARHGHGGKFEGVQAAPRIARQREDYLLKSLRDFKSGARTNAIMNPLVESMSDQDMRDLAAYYAYFPRLRASHSANEPAPQIVIHGAPMRNIPPCAACHGTIGYKVGTEWLAGESPVYLRAQLEAFASGERHNDISEQMRNVARGMTIAEIERAAAYYAGQP